MWRRRCRSCQIRQHQPGADEGDRPRQIPRHLRDSKRREPYRRGEARLNAGGPGSSGPSTGLNSVAGPMQVNHFRLWRPGQPRRTVRRRKLAARWAAPVTSIREGMRCHDWITVLGASAMASAAAVRRRCVDGTGRARRGASGRSDAHGRHGARRHDGFVLEGHAQPECQAPARSARGRVLCHRPSMRRRRQLDQ